jgi:hypothetical protein
MTNASVKEMIEKVYGERLIRFFDCPLTGPSIEYHGLNCISHKTVADAYKSAKQIRKMQIGSR